jgi:phosphoglycolate phosphatase
MKIEAVIWDWNGTMLNDLHISLYAINCLLNERNLNPISREQYLDLFTFPVIEYYEKIGFDFTHEPFKIPAHQFIDIYTKAVKGCDLHPEAYPCLTQISNSGLKQFILSAMEQQQLNEMVGDNRIDHFFEKVVGLDDHYAVSKIDNGHRLMKDHNLNAERTLLIGDTIHDFEVASALNCHCILVANGHQSKERLEKTGMKVVNNLSEIEIW